jgi:hypothetical protein
LWRDTVSKKLTQALPSAPKAERRRRRKNERFSQSLEL